MTLPLYINPDRSDMRGIKPGWYTMEDDGNLSSGPFASYEECVRGIGESRGYTQKAGDLPAESLPQEHAKSG